MVRYSKLAFRLLVQDYKVDLTYTPMMLAHEYVPPWILVLYWRHHIPLTHTPDSFAIQSRVHLTSAPMPKKVP